MVQIPASKILNAVEGASIERYYDDGIVAIIVTHDLLMAMPESPPPCVTVSKDNIVTVKSGDISVARIAAETSADAGDIATTLTELLTVA